MWDEKQSWLQKCKINEVSEEDPKLKKVISVNTTQIQENSLLTKLHERISSWTKMNKSHGINIDDKIHVAKKD